MRVRILIVVACLTLLTISLPAPVHAATTVGDGTPQSCTRKALQKAVKLGGTVNFNCGSNPVTININKRIKIKTDVTIDGGGLVTLDANRQTRIMFVKAFRKLTVKNLTFRDGKVVFNGSNTGSGGAIDGDHRAEITVLNSQFYDNKVKTVPQEGRGGGAIRVLNGKLTVRNSYFSGNKVNGGFGGAISSMLSNLEVTDTIITGGKAAYAGGAIHVDGTYNGGVNGYTILERVQITDNKSKAEGGGVWIYHYDYQTGSTIQVVDSKFSGNLVKTNRDGVAVGGGLRIGNGKYTIKNSLFVNNVSQGQGGGLWLGGNAKGKLTNVTISGNEAIYGGGIQFNNSGKIKLKNVTVVYNTAAEHGGGLSGGAGHVKLFNTLVAHNTANNPWDIHQNCAHTLIDGGGNLQFPAMKDGGDANCTHNVTITEPMIAGLNLNGGLYETHALLAGSPAIDAGRDNKCTSTDQRGVSRPQGASCDIGAYEANG